MSVKNTKKLISLLANLWKKYYKFKSALERRFTTMADLTTNEQVKLVSLSELFLTNIKIARNISVSYSNDLSVKDNLSQKFIQRANDVFERLEKQNISIFSKDQCLKSAELVSETVGYIRDIKNFKSLKDKDVLVERIFSLLEKINEII